MKLDTELTKNIPTMTPYKKEIATFTFQGVVVTALGFIAVDATGWWAAILWIVFSISLFKLGGDYNKVLQRENEGPKMEIFKP